MFRRVKNIDTTHDDGFWPESPPDETPVWLAIPPILNVVLDDTLHPVSNTPKGFRSRGYYSFFKRSSFLSINNGFLVLLNSTCLKLD